MLFHRDPRSRFMNLGHTCTWSKSARHDTPVLQKEDKTTTTLRTLRNFFFFFLKTMSFSLCLAYSAEVASVLRSGSTATASILRSSSTATAKDEKDESATKAEGPAPT